MYSTEKNKIINNVVIFKGVFRGIVILLVLCILKALLSSYFFSLNIKTLNILLIFENTLILMYLGIYAARNVENNGWLNGGLTGIIYMVIIILLGTINMPLSLGNIFLLVLTALFVGSIGGIIGINI